jgi:glycosyltransferase 2 family protein
MFKRWQFWLGLVISAFFLYTAFKGMHVQQVWEVIKAAQFGWVIPSVAVYFCGVWARSWRWRYLLRPIKEIPTKRLFPTVCIGYMGNNIYPIRAGELLRSYVLKRDEDVAFSASLATIIVERIFDGVVMLGFVFLNLRELSGLTATSGFIGSIQALAIWGAVIFIGVLAVFMLAAMFPIKAEKIVLWSANHILPVKWRERASGIMLRFLTGLECLRSPRDAFLVLLTSIVVWLFETGKYWFLMHAFPFRISFFALMLMNGIVNLATTLPSAPGYVGTFDAPGIALLQAYGIKAELAVAYTLVLHVALWLPITVLGAYYFLRKGLSWTGTVGDAKAAQDKPAIS